MRSLAFSHHCSFCSCDSVVRGGGVYGGGRTADRRISVGESSEEQLILGSTVGTVEMVNWEWKQRGVCGVMRVSKVDWDCRGWIVEVYKRFPGRIHWGSYRHVVFCLGRLDNSCLGAWECVA